MAEDSKSEAARHKELGNAAFSAKSYEEAITHFSAAIEADANDHVFYSNRSACYASLEQYDKALDDAEICVTMKPDWVRGYTRKGLAEFYLKKHEEAKATYQKGLELEPGNQQLQEGLARVQQAQAPPNPFGALFTPENLMKLQNHPKIREYMQQPDFMQMLTMMGQNPQMMQMFMQDPRMQEVMGVLLGLEGGMPGAPTGAGPNPFQATPPPQPQSTSTTIPIPTPAAKPTPPPAASKFQDPAQAAAEEFKAQGNNCYKQRQFKEAIEFYDQAYETYPKDIAYLTNKATALFEAGDYSASIEVCELAIEKGREMQTDLVKVGRALGRIGSAHWKLGNLDLAVEFTHKALLEAHDDKLKMQLKNYEKVQKEEAARTYINPELADEANTRGNDLFKEGKFPAAIGEYDEAIKRNPEVAKYYCNKATCYLKLLEPVSALSNIEKSIQLDPNYAKAFAVKGDIHYLMKEFHKAIDAFEKTKSLEPENVRAQQGLAKTMQAISSANSTQPDEQRMQHAMADPEIQNILRDPQINQVLKDM